MICVDDVHAMLVIFVTETQTKRASKALTIISSTALLCLLYEKDGYSEALWHFIWAHVTFNNYLSNDDNDRTTKKFCVLR